MKNDQNQTTCGEESPTAHCSPWHVWLIQGCFVVAENRQDAIDYVSSDNAIEPNEIDCDESNHDDADLWEENEDGDEGGRVILSTMREHAKGMITMGHTIPFICAVSDD